MAWNQSFIAGDIQAVNGPARQETFPLCASSTANTVYALQREHTKNACESQRGEWTRKWAGLQSDKKSSLVLVETPVSAWLLGNQV